MIFPIVLKKEEANLHMNWAFAFRALDYWVKNLTQIVYPGVVLCFLSLQSSVRSPCCLCWSKSFLAICNLFLLSSRKRKKPTLKRSKNFVELNLSKRVL